MKTRTVVSICLAAAIVLVLLADVFLYLRSSGEEAEPSVSASASPSAQEDEDEGGEEAGELTQEELLAYFEQSYQAAQVYDQDLSLEDMCEAELEQLEQLLNQDGYALPDGVEEDYLAWREQEHPYDELFVEQELVMYATANVNIRESYSADSNRVSGLVLGDSVTVTGIGRGEAEGWYRVIYQNWGGEDNVGYVNADYLSEDEPE